MSRATELVMGELLRLATRKRGTVEVRLLDVTTGSRARKSAVYTMSVKLSELFSLGEIFLDDDRGYLVEKTMDAVVKYLIKYMDRGVCELKVYLDSSVNLPIGYSRSKLENQRDKLRALDLESIRMAAIEKRNTVIDWAPSARRAEVMAASLNMLASAKLGEFVKAAVRPVEGWPAHVPSGVRDWALVKKYTVTVAVQQESAAVGSAWLVLEDLKGLDYSSCMDVIVQRSGDDTGHMAVIDRSTGRAYVQSVAGVLSQVSELDGDMGITLRVFGGVGNSQGTDIYSVGVPLNVVAQIGFDDYSEVFELRSVSVDGIGQKLKPVQVPRLWAKSGNLQSGEYKVMPVPSQLPIREFTSEAAAAAAYEQAYGEPTYGGFYLQVRLS
jgi:hypothetical protein